VPRVKIEQLRTMKRESQTDGIKEKISQARALQFKRLKSHKLITNSEMSSKMADKLIELDKSAENFAKESFDKSLLSARGYYRVLKVARTIADLENSEKVTSGHLSEAFSYRLKTVEV
jgi:magnesium chelatase family protein